MGMQINFCNDELPVTAKIESFYDEASDTYSAVVRFIDGNDIAAMTDKNTEQFWFDCGSAHDRVMWKIKQLIRNRVCFTAS